MNLGPLTTKFTPAPGCNATVFGSIYTGANGSTHKYHTLGLPSTTQCYPPGFTAAPDAFYSPGLCPSDWTSACGSVERIGTLAETRATCCPVGYVCVTSREEPWSTLSCSRFYTDPQPLIVPQKSDDKTFYMETTLTGINVFANDIRVRWRNGDSGSMASSTPPPSVTTSVSSVPVSEDPKITSASTSSAASDMNVNSASSSSLSKGAYAGIGIAVGVALVGLLTGFLIFMRKRRNNSEQFGEGYVPQNDESIGIVPEMRTRTPVREIGFSERQPREMHASEALPGELDVNRRAYELG